jgi:putative transposase
MIGDRDLATSLPEALGEPASDQVATHSGRRQTGRKIIFTSQIAVGAIGVGLWQILTSYEALDPFYFGMPSEIGIRLWEWVSSGYTSELFQRLMADHGVVCSMSRSGNVWDNAAMESFFSSLKTERTARKVYRSRDQAKADVFDYIERFYNPKRRHSTIGYLSPMEFERQAGLA